MDKKMEKKMGRQVIAWFKSLTLMEAAREATRNSDRRKVAALLKKFERAVGSSSYEQDVLTACYVMIFNQLGQLALRDLQ